MEAKNVEEIKKEIFGKYMPAYVKREDTEKDTKEKMANLTAENADMRKEIKELKSRIKELFKENSRLREFIKELKGGKKPHKEKWRELLGFD